MEEIDLNKLEKTGKSIKEEIKKKYPLFYIGLALIILYISFFGGAFLNDSKAVERFNIFNKWFGQEKVEIDFAPFPTVELNKTIIPVYIKNVGDKDIKELDIYYSFCGLDEQKAILGENKLYRAEKISFAIETPLVLNTSCQAYTNEIWADIYEDTVKNCYLDVPDDITENYCSFCKVKFSLLLDKKEQNEERWYPYLGDKINSGEFMRFVLVDYPINITWVQNYSSQCKVLVPNTSKTRLIKKEKIGLGFFDTYTMCERGEDVDWCKDYYYKK